MPYASMIPTGLFTIEGPKPKRVEYPYGLPGNEFRRLAPRHKTTCVAYHKGVDPRSIVDIEAGNSFRYDTDDPRFAEMVADMKENGYRGGPGQYIIVFIDADSMKIAEGNHRRRAALAAGLTSVDLQIHYKGNVDESFHLIPFDIEDPEIHIISD